MFIRGLNPFRPVTTAESRFNQDAERGSAPPFNLKTAVQLTNVSRTGTLTVAGNTTSLATNVTVNTSNAALYADTTDLAI